MSSKERLNFNGGCAMGMLIFLIGLIFGVMSFVGLISPKIVLGKWGAKVNRFQTFMIFISLFIACVLGSSSLNMRDYEERKKKEETELAEKKKAESEIAIQKKKREDEEVRNALKKRLETDRAKIIDDISALVKNGKYEEAFTEADKFKELNVAELKALSDEAHSKYAADQAKAEKEKNLALSKTKEEKILALLKSVQPSDYDKNLELYGKLVKLFPDNSIYKEKHDSFKKQKDKKLQEAQAFLAKKNSEAAARIAQFGEQPRSSAWDGSYHEVERYLKKVANDPSSIKMGKCTKVYHTPNGWLVGCDYRGKNAFGAVVRNSHWFTIVQGHVIKVEKIDAHNITE